MHEFAVAKVTILCERAHIFFRAPIFSLGFSSRAFKSSKIKFNENEEINGEDTGHSLRFCGGARTTLARGSFSLAKLNFQNFENFATSGRFQAQLCTDFTFEL